MESSENIVVVKVGTNVATRKETQFDLNVMSDLAHDISELMEDDHQVVLVSSGAVAAGRQVVARHPEIKLPKDMDPKSIVAKQFMAGIGQPKLMSTYEDLFLNAKPPRVVSQVLLTRNNLLVKAELKHILGPLRLYLNRHVVPILNENDTVAIDELKFGDNDQLAAMVAEALKARLLVILSDVEGVFDRDPKNDDGAKLIEEATVDQISEEFLEQLGKGTTNGNGTGGILSKVQAGMRAASAGVPTVIAQGKMSGNLKKIAKGEKIGTRILPPVIH